ncbi:MAG: bifunctional 5,10-methylenetetrahydrofolate dehydrogenase/5,10-methenyltetrahydrofolate cyclohydrolase [bacterium]|nr:bifunctional 5,10-methylenetetrahydrofolate dehydrogenase/5,10-methenyltetrahydrofolate cyclohydrolase [bacterium]
MIIDGRKIAENIISELKALKKPEKSLAAILVGENAQSESFLKQKAKIANQLGIDFRLIRLSGEMSELEIIKEIEKLNLDNSVGGIILQLPLPEKFKKENIIPSISSLKDIDALTEGGKKLVSSLVVGVVNDVLAYLNMDIKNQVVAVVGRGFLIGAPLLEYFSAIDGSPEGRKGKCLKIIALNSKSDIDLIKEADVVISGTGKPGLIKPELLKNNAVVIDFGYGLVDGKLKGDFYPGSLITSACLPVGRASSLNTISYTPTPGGTGPVLVAEIYKNFYKLNSAPPLSFRT